MSPRSLSTSDRPLMSSWPPKYVQSVSYVRGPEYPPRRRRWSCRPVLRQGPTDSSECTIYDVPRVKDHSEILCVWRINKNDVNRTREIERRTGRCRSSRRFGGEFTLATAEMHGGLSRGDSGHSLPKYYEMSRFQDVEVDSGWLTSGFAKR